MAGNCGEDMLVHTSVLTMQDRHGQFHEVPDDVAIRVGLRTHWRWTHKRHGQEVLYDMENLHAWDSVTNA
eukprot:5533216-Karenia_brevis.AAC.1